MVDLTLPSATGMLSADLAWAVLAFALATTACGLLPSPASPGSPRAVIALVAVIGLSWTVLAYLLGPRTSPGMGTALLACAGLALLTAVRWPDPRVRAWLGALGLALALIGVGDVLLGWAEVSGDLVLGSSAMAAIGAGVLVAGQRGPVRAMTVGAVVGWLAWLPGLAWSGADRGIALLAMLAVICLGLWAAALLRPDARLAITAAVASEATWLLALGTGQAGWAPRQVPIEAYTLGSLAVVGALVALLVRDGVMAHWTARRVLATVAIAVAVSWLAALGWSLAHESRNEVATVGWVGSVGMRLLWWP